MFNKVILLGHHVNSDILYTTFSLRDEKIYKHMYQYVRMEQKKGVHIVAAGFEYERIVKPIIEGYPAEKVIVLRHSGETYTHSTTLADHFLQKLKEFPVEIEGETVDIYDFDNVFLTTLRIIRQELENGRKVYVNISSAPKLALVAMMSAVFFLRDHGEIAILYSKPEEYLVPKIIDSAKGDLKDEFMNKGGAIGTMTCESIPVFPIEEITKLDRDIIHVLHEKQGVSSIKELVESMDDDIQRSSVQYRLEKLERMGLITKEREDKRAKLALTRVGEIYRGGTS